MLRYLVAGAVLIGHMTSADALANQAARSLVIGGWQGLTFSMQDLDPTDAFAASLTPLEYVHCFGLSPVCSPHPEVPPPPDFRLPASFQAVDGTGFPAVVPLEHTTTSDTLVFGLSPNTRLTITGSIFVDSSGPVYRIETSPPHLLDVAVASGNVAVRVGNRQIAAVSSSIGRDEQSFEINLQSPPQESLSSSLTFEEVLTSGTNISTAPEPATWALTCAGLIGLSWAVGRRRSTSQA